jgi:hypothetical protein
MPPIASSHKVCANPKASYPCYTTLFGLPFVVRATGDRSKERPYARVSISRPPDVSADRPRRSSGCTLAERLLARTDGQHIMLIDVSHSLVADAGFPETATFAHGGRITPMVSGQTPSATMHASDHDSIANITVSGMGSTGRGGAQ